MLQRARLAVRKSVKLLNKSRSVATLADRKENHLALPSTALLSASKTSLKLGGGGRVAKAKNRKETSLKGGADKRAPSKKRPPPDGQPEAAPKGDAEQLRLREICFIKGTAGKTMIAKYKNDKEEEEEFDDNLVVTWDKPSSKATVFTHKAARASSAPPYAQQQQHSSEPGTSGKTGGGGGGVFRIHNFAKKSAIMSKLKKQPALRRLVSAAELGKGDRKKKKKLRMK